MTQQSRQPKYKICAISTITHQMRYFVLAQMYYLKERGFDITVVCNMDDDFKSTYEKDFYPAFPSHLPVVLTRGMQ